MGEEAIKQRSIEMLSKPSNIKTWSNLATLRFSGNNYNPLYKKLNLSEEEKDEFKGILIDREMD